MTEPKRNIIFCGVLTISDRCAAGVAEDLSGPNLQKVLQEYPGIKAVVKMRKIVPDEVPAIKNTLVDWCDKENVNLILTTGGTGLSPRDVTPEATAQVLEKELNAVVIGIVAASLAKTRFSMLTRMKCGIRGKTLIVNFPGSKKVAEECLKFILPILNHANDVISNNLSEVDSFHRAAEACMENASTRPDKGSSTSVGRQPVVLPDIRQVNLASHALLDAHVIPQYSHSISTDHTIAPDSHAIAPDVHAIPPGAHVYPANAHTISQTSHTITPDAHSLGIDSHIITADAHGVRPDVHGIHHLPHSEHHGLLPSDAVELDSSAIERELQSGGLLETRREEGKNERTDAESLQDSSPSEIQISKALKPFADTGRSVNTIPTSYAALENIALKIATAEKRKIDPEFCIPMKVAKRNRVSPYPLVAMEQATATVLENANPLPVITVPYEDALGFVLAQDITAPEPIPQFAASIKDGYAVIAADTPGELNVVGSSIYGVRGPDSLLKTGEAIRITTGSPLPPGADAIVQVEDTKLIEDAKEGEIEVRIAVNTQVKKDQDIRPVGSDIQQGECVLRAGTPLGPSGIGILATLGITTVKVYKKPTVAVISTGNEITEPGLGPLEVGQVRDSNRKTLLSYLKQAGFETVDFGIVLDDPNKIKLCLETAFDKADVVITSGGVSLGEKDFLKTMIKAVGGTIHFGRVLMKPGKPTTFGTVNTPNGRKLIFALPGNPVSSTVTFNLFALPALKKMSGFTNPNATLIKARAGSGITLDARPEFQRCTVKWKKADSTPWAETTGNQISSRLSSMVNANALVVLPPKSEDCTEIIRGDLVDVLVIDRL